MDTGYAGVEVAAHPVDEQREEAVGELVCVAAGPQPGIGPVHRRQEQTRRRADVEIRAQLTEVAALAEQLADALLVAPALRDELVQPRPLEVAPFLDEDSRDVELLGNDAQVAAKGEPDLLGRRRVVRDRIECGVKGCRALAQRLPEQVLLRGDMGVERALLHAQGLGDVADRRAVIALLREQLRGLARQLATPSTHPSCA